MGAGAWYWTLRRAARDRGKKKSRDKIVRKNQVNSMRRCSAVTQVGTTVVGFDMER